MTKIHLKPIALLFLFVFFGAGAHCEPVSSQGPQLEDLAKDYRSSQDQLLESETKKRMILGELYQITEKIKSIDKKKSRLTDELLGAQSHIEDLSQSIGSLEKTTKLQRQILTQRLRVMYKFGARGFVKTLFSNHTSAEVDRFLKFLKIVSNRDYRTMREYQSNIAKYKAKKRRLTIEVKRLAKIKSGIKVEEDQLSTQHQASKRVLAQIDAKRLNQMIVLQRLRSKTEKIAAQNTQIDQALLKMLQPSFFEQKGLLPPPVNGPIIQKFGYFTDPIYKTRMSHKGVFFHSSFGSPVRAPFAGLVAFASDLEGYGKTIILDHGHHYYTVYAHNSALTVKPGDHVKQGQVIAKVGKSSVQFGTGLYFEIRHFSEPEDPFPWLRSSSVKISQMEKN